MLKPLPDEAAAGEDAEHLQARQRRGAPQVDLVFTEVFSGPRAPLTCAITRRVAGSVG